MFSMSSAEKQEAYEDTCAAYNQGIIGIKEFTACLAAIGYNATDISEAERFYRPVPPEDEDG